MCQVAQLENVVSRLCVTSFVTVYATQDWNSNLCDPKVHTAAVEIEKESAVEGRHGRSKLPVVFVFGVIATRRPHQDEICKDPLLLLPKIFGAHPREHQLEAVGRVTLKGIQTATPEPVHAPDIIHGNAQLLCEIEASPTQVFIGVFTSAVIQVESHAGEIPGNFEVVADDAAVLLPAVGQLRGPVVEEALENHLTAVSRGKVLDDVPSDENEHVVEAITFLLVLSLSGQGADKIDQVGGDVVAD